MQMMILINSLKSLRSRFQKYLETSMKESDSIFDLVQLMHYKCHKVIFKVIFICGGSYIDAPDRIKKKKTKMNPKKADDKCFQ